MRVCVCVCVCLSVCERERERVLSFAIYLFAFSCMFHVGETAQYKNTSSLLLLLKLLLLLLLILYGVFQRRVSHGGFWLFSQCIYVGLLHISYEQHTDVTAKTAGTTTVLVNTEVGCGAFTLTLQC